MPEFYILTAVFGLIIGSFLNVVIHRLPKMIENSWRKECAEITGMERNQAAAHYNLLLPPSACPACGHRIRPWENVPILSYLLLRGRCSECKAPISMRYPLVELLAGGLALLAAWKFGISWQLPAALFFCFSLLASAAIDLETQLLPDALTLLLLWAGLLVNLWGLFTPLPQAVIGAMAGYLSLWSVYHLFRLLTGKEGMGHGDFKLLAALAAWTGWKMLPLIILFASLLGAIIGLIILAAKNKSREIPIPFGPYLALAGLIALMWGPFINAWYLGLVQAK